jgi:hypothetical protein
VARSSGAQRATRALSINRIVKSIYLAKTLD